MEGRENRRDYPTENDMRTKSHVRIYDPKRELVVAFNVDGSATNVALLLVKLNADGYFAEGEKRGE